MLTIQKTEVPFGTFRGQRQLVVNYLTKAKGPVTFEKLVADLDEDYRPLLNEWALAKAGGVRGSVRYHLNALAKLDQVKLEGQELKLAREAPVNPTEKKPARPVRTRASKNGREKEQAA